MSNPSTAGAAAGVSGAKPQPLWSGKVLRLAVVLVVLGSVAVVPGFFMLRDYAFRRPVNPTTLLLLSAVLALMLTCLASVRLLRASASRYRRWQRAHAILLPLLSGYLLIQAFLVA